MFGVSVAKQIIQARKLPEHMLEAFLSRNQILDEFLLKA